MKLSSWPEIGSDGDVLLTPYVPKGITGYDDDDDDDDDVKMALRKLATKVVKISILIFGLCLYAYISSQKAETVFFLQCVKVCSLLYNLP